MTNRSPSVDVTEGSSSSSPSSGRARKSLLQRTIAALRQDWMLYLLLLPGLIVLVLFKWGPLAGLVIAFQDYSPFQGITHSPWVGLDQFKAFFSGPTILHLLKNTVILAFLNLIFTFSIPVLFAVFLNEVRNKLVRKTVQTLTFVPYFVSSAVIVAILYMLTSPQTGVINQGISALGLQPISFMSDPNWFRPMYVALSVWQTLGYSTVIYLAAMTAIDPGLYEAAEIDGAGRWRKMFHITLPSISNMIAVVFILNMGSLMTVDVEKVLLMYNPSIYSTADVIQTFVYRQAFDPSGFPNYSYAAAVGMMQSVIALILVILSNKAAKRFSESGVF